jgi:hypothetical protein
MLWSMYMDQKKKNENIGEYMLWSMYMDQLCCYLYTL